MTVRVPSVLLTTYRTLVTGLTATDKGLFPTGIVVVAFVAPSITVTVALFVLATYILLVVVLTAMA